MEKSFLAREFAVTLTGRGVIASAVRDPQAARHAGADRALFRGAGARSCGGPDAGHPLGAPPGKFYNLDSWFHLRS